MGNGATWWLAIGIVLGSSSVACVAAFGDSVRGRWQARRQQGSAAAGAFPTLVAIASPVAAGPPAAVAVPMDAAVRATVPAAPTTYASASAMSVPAWQTPAPVQPSTASGRGSAPPAPQPMSVPPVVGHHTGPVEVQLLGPFQVCAAGTLPGEADTALTALVALAALRPAGVPTVVVQRLFPAPDGLAAASRHLQDWLGLDVTGQPRLSEHAGVWRLSPEVWVDWHSFRELVTSPRLEGDPHRFARALVMVRGELLAGLSFPPAGQALVPPLVDGVCTTVTHAVRREVELATSAGDPQRAERALRQGLLLLPREEALWRLWLEL